jgi:two-component system sensor histidine kinase QseC
MIKIRNLRRFIVVTTLVVVCGGGLITAFANYRDAREQVEELFDAELAQMARVLQSIFSNPLYHREAFSAPLVYDDFDGVDPSSEGKGAEHEISATGHKYEKKLAFQIWDKDDKLLIQSQTAAANNIPRQASGFHTASVGASLWRVFTIIDADRGLRVQVAQREDVRTELTLEISEHLFMVPLMVLPLLAMLIWYLIGYAIAPVKRLSSEVSHRHMGNLTSIDASGVPQEIRGLVASLNALFARVKAQALMERRFTADAAHELRTPLAAIKIQLQNALRRMENDRASESLQKSLRALNRMIHLVEQLLLLNRLDSTQALEHSEKVPVADCIRSVLEEYGEPFRNRGIRLVLDLDETIEVEAHPSLLHSLIRNFVDNALRHTPEAGEIRILLSKDGLRIEDSGSGIPEDQLETVFQRFYRIEGDGSPAGSLPGEKSQGAGLGLAICRQIAGLYGFDLRIENRQGPQSGLCVIVRFPPLSE